MIASYLSLIRPAQWVKNLMLFFPPFLGGQIFVPGLLQRGVAPFCAFCLVSSSGYLLNDIMDRERDAHHPRKSRRPLASGRVGVKPVSFCALLLLAGGVALGWGAGSGFLVFLFAYLLVTLLYSTVLKGYPVVDLFCISAGFLIRLEAGAQVFGIAISPWLFLTVFLLAVFLATGKRLCEYRLLGEDAATHRKNLGAYPAGYLDGAMYMTGGAVLVTYAIYTIGRSFLVYSVPLCCFGLLRYILRVQSGQGGDPTEALLKDLPLLITGILWIALVALGIYR